MKKNNKKIGCFLMRIMILGICFFIGVIPIFGCRATPEIAPVVNKEKGISEDMIAEPLKEGENKLIDAPSHWQESMFRQNDRLEIKANADIQMPQEIKNTPILELEQQALSEKRLQELSEYFGVGSKYYKPLPLTKEELKIQLEKIEKGEGKYGIFSVSDREQMKIKIQELIEQAPVVAEKNYCSISFTSRFESEEEILDRCIYGKADTTAADLFIDVFAETGEEHEPEIRASTYRAEAGTESNFHFNYPGIILTKSTMKAKELATADEISYGEASEEKSKFAEEQKQQFSAAGVLIDSMAEISDVEESGNKILDDLGISDMGVASVEKGVFLPIPRDELDDLSANMELAEKGYLITYNRTAGTLVGFSTNIGAGATADSAAELYKPPFRVEEITIFIGNGKIFSFEWSNMAKVTKIVAENSNLLSFDEIKKRFADFLTFQYAIPTGTGGAPDDLKIRIDINKVELRADQIPAKDAPDKVWLVPAWIFSLEPLEIIGGVEQTNQMYFREINALDGGVILPYG